MIINIYVEYDMKETSIYMHIYKVFMICIFLVTYCFVNYYMYTHLFSNREIKSII